MADALAILAPLDALRRRWLALAGPHLRGVIVDRDRRVTFGFGVAVVSAFGLATVAPLHLLAVGPLVLGVPHVLADLRYLVCRPGLHRRIAFIACVGIPLAVLALTADPRAGAVAVAGAGAAATRGPFGRRAAVGTAGAGLVAAAHAFPDMMALSFAHAHNLVAVGWIAARLPREGRRLALVSFCGCALAIAFGGTLPVADALGNLSGTPLGVSLEDQSWVLAPMLPAPFDARLVVLFAFAQSVHYAVWLRLLPDALRPGKTPRSFAKSARALVADVGAPLAIAAAVLTLALVVHGAIDPAVARARYFSFALFHGYLEVAALGLLFAEPRR